MLRSSKPFVPSTRETGQPVYIQEGLFACVFTGPALHCRRQVSWESGFAPRCAELRGFTAEISQTVEQAVKRESSRARGIVQAPLPS